MKIIFDQKPYWKAFFRQIITFRTSDDQTDCKMVLLEKNNTCLMIFFHLPSVLLIGPRPLQELEERNYALDKGAFAVGRGQRWFLENRRPNRLKNALR